MYDLYTAMSRTFLCNNKMICKSKMKCDMVVLYVTVGFCIDFVCCLRENKITWWRVGNLNWFLLRSKTMYNAETCNIVLRNRRVDFLYLHSIASSNWWYNNKLLNCYRYLYPLVELNRKRYSLVLMWRSFRNKPNEKWFHDNSATYINLFNV